MEEYELIDLWRCQNPNKEFYTWSRVKNNRLYASRIDFSLYTIGIANKVKSVKYQPGYKTDHALISINIKIDENQRGPGYWKFNSKLLRDKAFVEQCNHVFDTANEKYKELNAGKKWEIVKRDTICIAKTRAKEIAQIKRKDYKGLLNRLTQVNEEIGTQGYKDILMLHKHAIVARIEEIVGKETENAIFLARCKYVKDNEKNTKYFYAKAKANHSKKTMTSLIKEDGTRIYDAKEILNEQTKFYKELYSANEKVTFNLQNNTETKLDNETKIQLDKAITMQEMAEAIKDLKKDKTPSLDGLTAEFFQFFYSKLNILLYDALVFAKQQGKLHLSARRVY